MNLSVPATAKVLIKYRIRRLVHFFSSGFKKKPKDHSPRTANAKKGMRSWITIILLSGIILFQSGFQAYIAQNKMDDVLGSIQVAEDQKEIFPAWNCLKSDYQKEKNSIICKPFPKQGTSLVSEYVAKGIALQLLVLLLTVFVLNIASKEIAKPEWDLEWLVTLPIPLSNLISVRFIERIVVNASGLLIILPFMTVLLWKMGWGYFSAPIGLFLTFALLSFEVMIRTVVDTGMRIIISASTLRNFQAIMSLVASGALFTIMSSFGSEKPILLSWSLLPGIEWVKWTPMGLVTRAVTSDLLSEALLFLALLGFQIFLIYFFTMRWLLYLLRFGIVAGGSREGVKRISNSVTRIKEVGSRKKTILSPLQIRELKLLSRDKNFMVQAVLLPMLFTGLQFFTSKYGDWKEIFQGSFKMLATTTFVAAAYSLIFSVFQVLNAEGKSLWMLYTFPNRLENLLREKVYLWIGVALLYPLVLFGTGIFISGIPKLESLILIIIVFLGVLIYGTVAACFGVFSSDPLAEDPRQSSRVEFTYLYMILAGFYAYAIFANSY